MPHPDFYSLPCLLLDERELLESTEDASRETAIALFVNGRHAETAILSPGSLEEYTIGYLFSEEIIRSKDDIESIKFEKNRISILTTNPFRITGRRKTILAGCGGSTSYIDTTSLPRIEDGVNPISLSVIRKILSQLPGEKESAILMDRDGEIIASFHDIGCSPAVDRVIGYGIQHGLDFSGAVLGISGRITSEMVRRCLLAKIPILVSRGQVTDLAVSIADETNLCIISHIRDGRPACFSHPERIKGSV